MSERRIYPGETAGEAVFVLGTWAEVHRWLMFVQHRLLLRPWKRSKHHYGR